MQVTTQHLSRAYGKTLALDDVSLTFSPGLCGLLGPNGAGKTTLLRLLADLLRPTSGSVFYDELELAHDQQTIRGALGYLPQDFGFYRQLTGREFLDFAAAMKGLAPGPERRSQIDEAIEQTGLAEMAGRRVGSYSGGTRQRLGIAQALIGRPRVLILDEPTVGLDPEERIRFRNLLADLARSRTVILSTHVVADIEVSCDHLAVIRRGRLVYSGRPEGLAAMAAGRVFQLGLPAAAAPSAAGAGSSVQGGTGTSAHPALPPGPWRLISSRQTENGVTCRLLAAPGAIAPGRPAEPRLEDGYLALSGDLDWQGGADRA